MIAAIPGSLAEAALTLGYYVSRFQREERCLDNPTCRRGGSVEAKLPGRYRSRF